MSITTTGLLLIAFGIFAMLGSALNWRIVTRPGKLFNMLLGDKVARIIYFVVGIFVFILGIQLMIGVHWLPL